MSGQLTNFCEGFQNFQCASLSVKRGVKIVERKLLG